MSEKEKEKNTIPTKDTANQNPYGNEKPEAVIYYFLAVSLIIAIIFAISLFTCTGG